ncbi:radical SAM protein, partial [Candidatus Woesearchaeota archaeon]|nr:radical SAM protein [Candidatus Woesearchaeota archaeon]
MGEYIDEVLRLGMRCNFNCPFCNVFNNEEVGERTLEDMKRIVDAAPRDLKTLSLSGGEPTLYPYLGDLVEYVKAGGWEVMLQTNASLVDLELARSLKESGVDKAFVNFPSHLPEVYAELTGTNEGLFHEAVS